MRLPLAILTGVGFIGGGTIIKKGDIVVGVTTAATLWLAWNLDRSLKNSRGSRSRRRRPDLSQS